MKALFYSAQAYDKASFDSLNHSCHHQLRYTEKSLNVDTVSLLEGEQAVCVFVNDSVDEDVLRCLSKQGVKLIALRCAGYNNVDIDAAKKYGIRVVNVPAYSPNAVAEHTIALMLGLNRHLIEADQRVRKGNFSLDGLLGFDFNGRSLGIIGTGKIGMIVAKIMAAMGMRVIAYDKKENTQCKAMGVDYMPLEDVFSQSDVISLHCPLTDESKHLINAESIKQMKDGVMLVNTSRGAVLDTCAVIDALEAGKIAYLGLDVYEFEKDLYFRDLSCSVVDDDIFKHLLRLPNVMITAHQAFFTEDALRNIAATTLENLSRFESGKALKNEIVSATLS